MIIFAVALVLFVATAGTAFADAVLVTPGVTTIHVLTCNATNVGPKPLKMIRVQLIRPGDGVVAEENCGNVASAKQTATDHTCFAKSTGDLLIPTLCRISVEGGGKSSVRGNMTIDYVNIIPLGPLAALPPLGTVLSVEAR